MKSSRGSPPSGSTGPTPPIDRRALERIAVGAPPPAPIAPVRAIERGARVTRGCILRRIRATRRRPPAPVAPPPPLRIAIGQPISARRRAQESSFDPLYLLVPGERSRQSGAAAAMAAETAQRFSGDREVLLIDLDHEYAYLSDQLGEERDEGVAEALEFGASLPAMARRVARQVGFVGLGALPPDLDALVSNPGWVRIVEHARRRGIRLLAYLPAVPERVAALAEHAGAVLLIGTPEEERKLRQSLPPGLPVLGVLQPTEEQVAEGRRRKPSLRAGTPPAPVPPPPAPEPATEGSNAQDRPVADTGEKSLQEPPARPRTVEEWVVAQGAQLGTAAPSSIRPAGTAESPAEPGLTPSEDRTVPPGEMEDEDLPTSVPRTTPARERWLHVAAVVILAYWTYYIAWRWLATLNLDALWFSVPLALAETWGWFTGLLLVFTLWRLNRRTPPPAPPNLSVDVLVTVFSEPIEVVRQGTLAAREIRYPHKTYLLDGRGRAEVQALANELGVGYISRPDGTPGESGVLNHALGETSGEYVLQLNADHLPDPRILDRLLGYFGDLEVGCVQAAWSVDEGDTLPSGGAEVGERKFWFSLMQPGKDATNSAFYCGSGALLRRRALDQIGGFATGTVAEALQTSLLLHNAGWKLVPHGEPLVHTLAPVTVAEADARAARDARGAMQVLRRFNLFTHSGLSRAQRLSYLHSLTAPFGGLQKLAFYSAPLVFFLTGVLPIRTLDTAFLVRFIAYLILSTLLLELLSRGVGFAWTAKRIEMTRFWTHVRAFPTLFTGRAGSIPEGRGGTGRFYRPQLALLVLTAAGILGGSIAAARGWVEYRANGGPLAFPLNVVWAATNLALAAYVVRRGSLSSLAGNGPPCDWLPVRVAMVGNDGRPADQELAVAEKLHVGGLSLRSVRHYPIGGDLRVGIPLSSREVEVDARVVLARPDPDPAVPAFIHELELHDVPHVVRDAIASNCPDGSVPPGKLRYGRRGRGRRGRGTSGRSVRLLAILRGAGEQDAEAIGILDTLLPGGAELVLKEGISPGRRVDFEIEGTRIGGSGRVTAVHALETPFGIRFRVRLATEDGGSDTGSADPHRPLFTSRRR